MIAFGGFGPNPTGLPYSTFYVLSLPVNTADFIWTSPTFTGFDPGVRQWHGAIHDPLGPRMVTFGGVDDNTFQDGTATNGETWTLTPGLDYSWNQLSFASTPPPRQGHVNVYDEFNQRMMLFAGGDAGSTPLNPPDLWALTFGVRPKWSLQIPSGTAPGARQYFSAVWDNADNRMVIYGGQTTSGSTDADEVWWIKP